MYAHIHGVTRTGGDHHGRCFHLDALDQDDFEVPKPNPAREDEQPMRWVHTGWVNETQRTFDPALFGIVRIGSFLFAHYADEVVAVRILGPGDDVGLDMLDEFILELARKFKGRVAL